MSHELAGQEGLVEAGQDQPDLLTPTMVKQIQVAEAAALAEMVVPKVILETVVLES
jgi:hypothetical protein